MTVIHCTIHGCTAESFISRCFYSLWASANDPCALKEYELKPVPEVDGQSELFERPEGFGIWKAGGPW